MQGEMYKGKFGSKYLVRNQLLVVHGLFGIFLLTKLQGCFWAQTIWCGNVQSASDLIPIQDWHRHTASRTCTVSREDTLSREDCVAECLWWPLSRRIGVCQSKPLASNWAGPFLSCGIGLLMFSVLPQQLLIMFSNHSALWSMMPTAIGAARVQLSWTPSNQEPTILPAVNYPGEEVVCVSPDVKSGN